MGSISIAEKVLSYIEDNLDKDLSLEKMANELNYSKFYIARAFKENTGCTVYKYIQSRRLNEAARKLVQTKLPIVEIALEAGYGSQQAFTQAFRYQYTCTPQEYRKIGIFVPMKNRMNMSKRITFFSCVLGGGKCAA